MGMGRRSHLAGAAGTGLSLGNEALAILNLPALVVAVCRDQGPEGVLGGSGRFWGGSGRFWRPARAHTLTDRAAPTLGVEGVGAHNGTFQGRAGYRAQLRETGETPEGRALGTRERPRSFSLQRSQKPGFSPQGRSRKSSGNARPSPHQADAAQAGIQRRWEGLVVGKDSPHVGTACRERGSGGPQAAQNPGIPGAPSPAEQSGQHCPGMRMG